MIKIRENLTLKSCRIIAGIKADEIVEAAGVTVDTVYKWEKGRSFPNAPQMVRILKCFADNGYALDVTEMTGFISGVPFKIKMDNYKPGEFISDLKYMAIQSLFRLINKRFGMSIDIDVDLECDKSEFLSYVQYKYYKNTIAYVWPEAKDCWLEEKNGLSVFDVFCTDSRNKGSFWLKCPHCGRIFGVHTRYAKHRKSLVPCSCECEKIEKDFEEAIRKYKETGEIVSFDDSLQSRRLYDRMESVVSRMWRCQSKEEAELYKKLGFDSPYIDVYLSLYG